MIRVVHPVPPARQFHLLDLATRRTRRAIEQRRRDLRSRPGASESLQASHAAVAGGDSFAWRWREAARQDRAAYVAFEEKYDRLVGLLCLAAQEGVTAEREASYRAQRAWFERNYAGVKRELSRFLTSDSGDTAPGLWGRRSCDAFEALFLPGSLAAMLAADDGHLIGRLMRTQEALTGWDASIRRSEKSLAELPSGS